jgi:hypothetical protein
MPVAIAGEVTRNWPLTENKLAAESDIDYDKQKAAAIARAKIDVYGSSSAVPDRENDIPDVVAFWIADKATIYLIPLAQEYYATKERLSTTKEGATASHYDKLAMLEGLRRELEASCADSWEDVLDLVGSATDDADDIPAVSTDGMVIDPLERAGIRGPF